MPGGASPRRADSENNENRTMKIKSIRTHILQASAVAAVRVPDGPGLGIEIDRKALARFAAR